MVLMMPTTHTRLMAEFRTGQAEVGTQFGRDYVNYGWDQVLITSRLCPNHIVASW